MLDRTNADAMLQLLEHAELIAVIMPDGKKLSFDPKMFTELRQHVAWDGLWPDETTGPIWTAR